MKDFFYEETANVINRKKAGNIYLGMNIASIICFIGALVLVIVLLFGMDFSKLNAVGIIGMIIPFVACLGLGFGFYFFKNNFYLDFDYTIVTGNIRIAKVIKEIKRKKICEFDCDKIVSIGKYGSNDYNKYEKSSDVKRVFLTLNKTPDDNKDFYYMLVNLPDGRKIYVFECTKQFINNVVMFTGKGVLTSDLK